MKNKVLVTGAAGFIGSHLVDYLIKKKNISKIIGIDNLEDGSLKNIKEALKSKKFIFFKKDIKNSKSLKKVFNGIDIVFHLAAYSDVVPSITNPKLYMENNINGTINVIEAIRENNVKKLIFAASSSCYGIPRSFPTKEKDRTDPQYPYSISKLICEDIIKYWSLVYGLKYISLRLFNVYGTRSRTNSAYGAALGVFLKQKLSNKPFTIIGNGKQKRDFIYVKDVCDAFYKAAISKISNQTFNIGKGRPRSVNELVKILGGKKIFIPKRPGEPQMTFANINKAKKILNWKPKIELEEGLSIVLKNIDYWKDSILWTPKKIKIATKDWFKYLKK